tara:strand:- start:470 stop:673 length:204 start_codon:yes stop_codon:yes gene_type:complete
MKSKKQLCINCKSKKTELVCQGLETDTYKCLKCKKRFGVTDLRRLAGFTREEIEEMDREDERSRKNK